MKSGRPVALIRLALLVAMGLGGLAALFRLQFGGGRVYGPGSSLRADGEGTMIYYESLGRLPGREVSRFLESPDRLPEDAANTTLFLLSAEGELLRNKDVVDFVKRGGRVIVGPAPNASVEPRGLLPGVDLEPLPGRQGYAVAEVPDAPSPVLWRNLRMAFELDEEVAEAVYTLDGKPMVARKRVGEGEWIALVGLDPLLNLAMYGEPESDWLAWLTGGRGRILFYELHFGAERPRGVMALIRESGLLGVVLSLAGSFGLWVWMSSVRLLPPFDPREEPRRGVQSRLRGFRDLLKRYVPAEEVNEQCLLEWEKTFMQSPAEARRLRPLWEEARRELATTPPHARSRTSEAVYRRLHTILTQKRTRL